MKKIFCLTVVLLNLISPIVTKAAANWGWIYSDDEVTIWIDNNSVGRDSNGFFAYFKWAYSNTGRNRQIEMRRSIGLSVSRYYNFSETIRFDYFKNSSGIKYSSPMCLIDYDKNGNTLYSWSTNNFNWQRIIPDTHGETTYDAAWARVRGK